jgi:hypothetical protein
VFGVVAAVGIHQWLHGPHSRCALRWIQFGHELVETFGTNELRDGFGCNQCGPFQRRHEKRRQCEEPS